MDPATIAGAEAAYATGEGKAHLVASPDAHALPHTAVSLGLVNVVIVRND